MPLQQVRQRRAKAAVACRARGALQEAVQGTVGRGGLLSPADEPLPGSPRKAGLVLPQQWPEPLVHDHAAVHRTLHTVVVALPQQALRLRPQAANPGRHRSLWRVANGLQPAGDRLCKDLPEAALPALGIAKIEEEDKAAEPLVDFLLQRLHLAGTRLARPGEESSRHGRGLREAGQPCVNEMEDVRAVLDDLAVPDQQRHLMRRR
mmetsp:Transcript_8870/g.25995  ORF Transcript_8870/g.25995 Transcript_8870/m.25995 type:complete len:206 (+) Transcript_8870:302-919(+)